MVDLLNINKAEDEQKTLLEELTDSVIAVEHRLPTIHVTFFVQDVMPGIEIILGQKGHFWLQSNFSSLDER